MTEVIDQKKKVFVVYGRNEKIKREVFAFLRILELSPIPWGDAARLTNTGAPYIGEILDAMLREAQAVVVLFTGDDEVRAQLIKSEFCIDDEEDNKEDFSLLYQPRPNVVFETGMAFSNKQTDRTILVEIGNVRICQMVKGRDRIKLSNQWKHRWRFIQSLEAAGCSVIKSNLESIRNMGNFDIEY
jgi:predicted nucleotide-binding protein